MVFAKLLCSGVIYEHCLHEKLECMIVYCALLSVCASASPAISTLTISAFSLGSLMAMFLVQAAYYVYALTIQLQNKDQSSRWCHPCILCTQSQGENKENMEEKIYPQRSHIVYIGHNPRVVIMLTIYTVSTCLVWIKVHSISGEIEITSFAASGDGI